MPLILPGRGLLLPGVLLDFIGFTVPPCLHTLYSHLSILLSVFAMDMRGADAFVDPASQSVRWPMVFKAVKVVVQTDTVHEETRTALKNWLKSSSSILVLTSLTVILLLLPPLFPPTSSADKSSRMGFAKLPLNKLHDAVCAAHPYHDHQLQRGRPRCVFGPEVGRAL